MPKYVLGKDGWVDKVTGEPWTLDTSATPCLPRINTSDSTEPLVSMADGKTYTSKAAMRESYKAGNNPKGVDFIEVGNDPDYINPKPRTPLEPNKEDLVVALDKAEAAIARGEFQDVP